MPSSDDRASLFSLTLAANPSARFVGDERGRVWLGDLGISSSVEGGADLRGRCVLVSATRQLPAALAAIELDGVARRLLLCPPDLADHLPYIVQAAGVDAVLTDKAEPALGVPVVRSDGVVRHPGWSADRKIDTEWVLFTSGTTGRPKMVVHTLSSLAGPLDDGSAVAAGTVWSTFYDIRRYGGLQILLRSLLGGGSMVLSSPDEATHDFLTRLGRSGVTHISGTPSHWRKALMSPAVTAVSPRYVRLSGEIADQAILDSLARTFPGSDIAHAFASTEAGVAFDVRDGKAGFPASVIEGADGKAEVRVVNGTLHVRSSRTSSGYINGRLSGSDGFVDTGDLVERRGDRYYFLGRREGVINVGGQKVFPEEVEDVIAQHPAIQMARVWARKNPITGAVVAADVVLRAGTNADFEYVRAELVQHCRSRLPRWKLPATIRRVSSIELNASGKVARRA